MDLQRAAHTIARVTLQVSGNLLSRLQVETIYGIFYLDVVLNSIIFGNCTMHVQCMINKKFSQLNQSGELDMHVDLRMVLPEVHC